MQPNELVSYAVEKAKANLRYVLERAEFLLEHPIVDIDSALIDSFTEYCIRYLGDSFRRDRKGHYGPTDSNCIIGDNFVLSIKTPCFMRFSALVKSNVIYKKYFFAFQSNLLY